MRHLQTINLLALAGLLVAISTGVETAAGGSQGCGKEPPARKISCYEKKLETLLVREGTEAALTALEGFAKAEPMALREAHPLAHHIGRRSVAHYKDARVAMSHCRDAFWSGCYHGVLEGYLGSLAKVEPKHIVPLCKEDADPKQRLFKSLFEKYNCVHGLGHGLTINFQHDVLKSLAFCDALPTDWDRESCYGGVFMENIVAFQNTLRHRPGDHQHAHHKSFLNPQDPLYPCSALAQRYLDACYLMQSSAILTFNGYDFVRAFGECDKATAAFVPVCYQSMGRDISGFTLRDVKKTMRLCQLGREDRRQDCYTGAVKDFILTHADPDRGLALCLAIDSAYKDVCYRAVGEMLVSLYPDIGPRQAACGRAESPYVKTCKEIALAN